MLKVGQVLHTEAVSIFPSPGCGDTWLHPPLPFSGVGCHTGGGQGTVSLQVVYLLST